MREIFPRGRRKRSEFRQLLVATGKKNESQEETIMGKLTSEQRRHLPSSDFVFPERRAYPIDTPGRARNALARVSTFGTGSEKAEVCSAVASRYPRIHARSCPMHGSSMPPGISAAERRL